MKVCVCVCGGEEENDGDGLLWFKEFINKGRWGSDVIMCF